MSPDLRSNPVGGEPAWLAANRDRWDDLARLHEGSPFYDLPGVVAGQDHLRPWEDAELGLLAGRDVIHLQCHIGTDTVALARRGARVVGLDFSSRALAVARKLAAECGLEVEWVEADVHRAAAALGGRDFDVVYTGMGALGWLPDLWPWAAAVRDLLRPGGILYVTEIHPMWQAVIEDGRTLCQDSLGAALVRFDEHGSYADPGARLAHTVGYDRVHAISDLLSAVLDAGLAIELFHEFDRTPAPAPWLERGPDGLFRLPEGVVRFPLAYSLRARRQS